MEDTTGLDEPAGRSVTLLLVDENGRALGRLEPFEVETPWWQDVLPITRRISSVTVLRLLDCVQNEDGRMGGSVTYLAELRGPSPGLLEPCEIDLEDHPLRMPWARPGGPAADLAWAAGIAEFDGPPIQFRTWNLSSIWSVPTKGSMAWLKCVPPFFAHEASVISLLAGEAVPRLLGAESHRILLESMPGEDGYEASLDEHIAAIEALVQLQKRTIGREEELLMAGVPDCRASALVDMCRDVVLRRAPTDERLLMLVESGEERMAAVAECGLPDVLVHGDAHPGNTRLRAGEPLWFDWGDSRLGNPLLDMAVLFGPSAVDAKRRARVGGRWLEAWAEAVPGSDPERAWVLIRPMAELRLAALYQSFLDRIEPSERPFHEGDVIPALERAALISDRAPL